MGTPRARLLPCGCGASSWNLRISELEETPQTLLTTLPPASGMPSTEPSNFLVVFVLRPNWPSYNFHLFLLMLGMPAPLLRSIQLTLKIIGFFFNYFIGNTHWKHIKAQRKKTFSVITISRNASATILLNVSLAFFCENGEIIIC